MAMKRIDTKYVKRLKKGDMQAFDEIYDFYKDLLYIFSLSVVKEEAAAQDVLQETFVQVLKDINTLKKNDSFHAWIYTITYNQSIRIHRKNKNIAGIEDSEVFFNSLTCPEDWPNELLHKKDIVEAVKDEIEKLPIKYIQIAQFHFLSGFSVKEISSILSIPERTVRDRIQRIKIQLQTKLSKRGYNPTRYFSIILGYLISHAMKSLVEERGLSDSATVAIRQHTIVEVKGDKVLTSPTKTTGTSMTLFTKVIIALSIICVSTIGLIAFNSVFDGNGTEDMGKDFSLLHEVIDSISYNKEPTRKEITVSVELSKEVTNQDIQILYKSNPLSYVLKDNKLTFIAVENGTYEIEALKDKKSVTISNIDKHYPEITTARYYNGYLQIEVLDEESRINYQGSYVVFNGKKLFLSEDGKVEGQFYGLLTIYLQDKKGNVAEYVAKINTN